MGYITLMPSNYFVLTNIRASTNYDNAVSKSQVFGITAGTAPGAGVKPFVPNCFTVQIARGQNNTYSNQPITQAEIASSGYAAGKQLPLPVIYGPRFNFSLTFTDTTGLFLSTGDGATTLALSISFWFEGYTVPIAKWPRFLNYFPALGNVLLPSGG